MIARVKIAPVEQWCAEVKEVFAQNPSMEKLVGVSVEIRTDEVSADRCDGKPSRRWMITSTTRRILDEIVGETKNPADGRGTFLCEHMLEMD